MRLEVWNAQPDEPGKLRRVHDLDGPQAEPTPLEASSSIRAISVSLSSRVRSLGKYSITRGSAFIAANGSAVGRAPAA